MVATWPDLAPGTPVTILYVNKPPERAIVVRDPGWLFGGTRMVTVRTLEGRVVKVIRWSLAESLPDR